MHGGLVALEFCYILACFSRVVLATVTFPLHLWILNLLKNKTGDITDARNYRAIAISKLNQNC